MRYRLAEAARSHAENGMMRNSLRRVVDAVTKALVESRGIGSIPASERLHQFKITLLEAQPPSWRIQVKNGTLDKLHEHIQTAKGWPRVTKKDMKSSVLSGKKRNGFVTTPGF
ncbi:MAG: hypothetical protein J5I93_09495 [Pirellulaceae bacterium]|nr:hypothetical protein [Pirellulaceae bacterium]